MREFHTPLNRVIFKADCIYLDFLDIQIYKFRIEAYRRDMEVLPFN